MIEYVEYRGYVIRVHAPSAVTFTRIDPDGAPPQITATTILDAKGQIDHILSTALPLGHLGKSCKGCGEQIDTELALGLWCKACATDKFGDAR